MTSASHSVRPGTLQTTGAVQISGTMQILELGDRAMKLSLVTSIVWLTSLANLTLAEPNQNSPADDSHSPTAAHDESASNDVIAKVVVAKIGEPTIRRIGPVTTVTEVSTGLPFRARVDTGATTCSIHYEAIEIEDAAKSPEDNVGKRIRILVKNSDGKPQWINTKIVDRVIVRTTTDEDERYKVQLKLRWENVEKKVMVTLSDREKMKYPVLLGRNFLRGDFIVDVDLDSERKP